MSRFSKLIFCAAAVLGIAACTQTANIKGVISDAPASEVVVKMLNVNQYQVIDTLKTDAAGKFSCKVEVAKGQPEFVYVFYKDRKVASLLLEAGDKVSVQTDTLGNSVVEGSEESMKLAAVEAEYAKAKAAMRSLSEQLLAAESADADKLREQLSKTYVEYYRGRVAYVMQNNRSLTIVPVLYQSLTESLPVFAQTTDAILFSNIADTLEMAYPDSKYVKALRKEANARLSQMNLISRIESAKELDFLDVNLPNLQGQKTKLSEVHKKVTLLYFWTASDAAQKMFNLDVLAPVYEQYKDRGFEIYQVSLDVDNGMWARVVREQKLPWVNVSDISGASSKYAALYNLSNLPAAFLIGGNGMVNATIKDAASLSEAIEKAL